MSLLLWASMFLISQTSKFSPYWAWLQRVVKVSLTSAYKICFFSALFFFFCSCCFIIQSISQSALFQTLQSKWMKTINSLTTTQKYNHYSLWVHSNWNAQRKSFDQMFRKKTSRLPGTIMGTLGKILNASSSPEVFFLSLCYEYTRLLNIIRTHMTFACHHIGLCIQFVIIIIIIVAKIIPYNGMNKCHFAHHF